MPWMLEPASLTPARVLLVSQRRRRFSLSRALGFEFEDAARTVDAIDLIASDRESLPASPVQRSTGLLERLVPRAFELLVRDGLRLEQHYDVLFVVAESLQDLLFVRPLSGLLRRARTSVCFVDEIWRKGLPSRTSELRVLSRFDFIFLGSQGSVEHVAELTGRPCAYLPASVDAVALCPYPDAPPRLVDVYWMGRRSEATHRALLELARRERWFYLYDTLERCNVPDPRAHRQHLAELLKRSRYFFAYTGKVNATDQTGGQQEIGSRYFEGAAAGTVMVGEPPANPWFDKLFGWRDAMVHLPYGSTDTDALLGALDLDPAREHAIRRTNVVESLRRHDHVYRWAEILRCVGLSETTNMELRRSKLRALADAIARDEMPYAPAGRAARGR